MVSRGSQPESQRPLRLAHLTTVDMSLALLLATELDEDLRAGYEVFGISAPGKYVERVESLGVTHVPIRSLTRSWSLLSDLQAFFEMIRTFKRLKLDVLHTHTPKAGVMGRIAGRLAGIPVVVNTCHGLWARPDDSWLKRTFVYGLEALAIRFSNFELFQNEEDSVTLRKFLKRHRWQVVGNGIDLDRFQPDPDERALVRAEWSIEDDQLVVGTIGRRVREKGLAEFAETAHELGDKAVFVWVGPEDDTDSTASVPHQDAIRFVDERDDMPAVYSAFDIFVLASYREGFSRASMEASACELPMVLSDIRGCREIGADGEHLLLAPPRDAAAFTERIAALLDDRALRERLGSAARARALREFDQRELAGKSLTAYEVSKRRKLKSPTGHTSTSNKKLVVLHVIPQDMNRGAQAYAGQLRDSLQDDPVQEHLVVSLFKGAEGSAHPDISLDVPSTPARKVICLLAVRRLRRLIRTLGADVVVAHGGEALKYAIPAAGRTPTIYYKLGLSSAEVNRPLHKSLYRVLSNRATKVVGVSHAIVDQVAELFHVPKERLELIPNGRDPEIFRPLTDSEQAATPPRILFVGQFEPGKQPHLFLDVVKHLRNQQLSFSAAMVGDGPLRESLEPRAEQLGVELLGIRNDVPELLRRSSALVMTSAPDTEGMPGVLIEAGLSAIPVVATGAAGVAEVVIDGQTGFVVSEGTPEGLAERVSLILSDKQLQRDLGDAARERCLALFSVQATTRQWKGLAGSVANPRPQEPDLGRQAVRE